MAHATGNGADEQRAAAVPGRKGARGGEIILRAPQRRIIFIAGLAGAALLAVVLGVFAWL